MPATLQGGPPGRRLPSREAVAPPKPSRKLRGSPLLSTVQPAARPATTTPPTAAPDGAGGRAHISGDRRARSAATVGPGTPRPASGRLSLEDGASIAPVWAATGHTVQFGRESWGRHPETGESRRARRRGRGGKSGGVREAEERPRWGPATPGASPAPGFRPEELGAGRLGIAWSRVPRGRAAAAGGARRPGGVGAGVM